MVDVTQSRRKKLSPNTPLGAPVQYSDRNQHAETLDAPAAINSRGTTAIGNPPNNGKIIGKIIGKWWVMIGNIYYKWRFMGFIAGKIIFGDLAAHHDWLPEGIDFELLLKSVPSPNNGLFLF